MVTHNIVEGEKIKIDAAPILQQQNGFHCLSLCYHLHGLP